MSLHTAHTYLPCDPAAGTVNAAYEVSAFLEQLVVSVTVIFNNSRQDDRGLMCLICV